MFIVNAGMPKSGSTLFSFYQKRILEYCIPGQGQEHFENLISSGIINGVGHFVHDIEKPERLQQLWELSVESGPFVVKTHAALTEFMKGFFLEHDVVITFIHRDPRDIILSAIDHGKRPVKNPVLHSYFKQFTDVEHSIPLVREFCHTGYEWFLYSHKHLFSYHDLLAHPFETIRRFAGLLQIEPSENLIRQLVTDYTVNQEMGQRQFNTGKLIRWSAEMNTKDAALCNELLKNEILQLGYSV